MKIGEQRHEYLIESDQDMNLYPAAGRTNSAHGSSSLDGEMKTASCARAEATSNALVVRQSKATILDCVQINDSFLNGLRTLAEARTA